MNGMPEELDPNSLSDASIRTDGTVRAYEDAQTLKDLDVVDVDGRRVGRVIRCFTEEGSGELTYCEVTLDEDVRRTMHVERDVARMEPDWIRDVDAAGIHLRRSVGDVVGVNRGDGGGGGSDTFPRSER